MAGDFRRFASVLAAVATGIAAIAPAVAHGAADQPNWKYFKNVPFLDGNDADRRVVGCYPAGSGSASPCTVDERGTPADATHPWDVPLPPAPANPTGTTSGPFADTALSALNPIAPGPDRTFRPVSVERDYIYPWTDAWRNSQCNPSNFSGVSSGSFGTNANDVNAAIVNVFVAHNHMHDWSKGLGFTPATFNMEGDDPVLGNVQAGAKSGQPTFSGRDAANRTTPADGVSPSFTSYLWQPIGGAYYPQCTDGSFDMSLLAHEYAHAIANRMVGGPASGLTSSTDGQALAIGEGFADSAAVAYLHDHLYTPADDEDPFAIGAYVTGNRERGIRNYSMADSPLNYSNVDGWDGTGGDDPGDDGEIWAAVNHDIRDALVAAHPADGNRRWIRIAFDALLTMPADTTMVQARDAYVSAAAPEDRGALWTAFARRGLGSGASSAGTDDASPEPSFESPLRADESTVTFAPGVEAELFIGDYEAGVTPVADTDPATARDATFELLPGNYSFLVRADGRGGHRFARDIPAGSDVRLDVQLPVNTASAAAGATATGDGTGHGELIDDTEATNWERTGAAVAGTQVTVDLAGGAQVVDRVNVSALLHGTDNGDVTDDAENQSRFSALRQFELQACSAGCGDPASFTAFYTSPANAFPGAPPRPVTPDLNLRSFDVPDTTATHLRLVVQSNQCTGSSVFATEQETDPDTPSDCRATTGPVARSDRAVRAAELQVFSSPLAVTQTNTPKGQPTGSEPGSPTPTGPGAAPDAPPRLTSLSLSNRRFRRGRALPRAAATRKGTVISFRLSEAARVTYSFRRRAGRRYVRAGTLTRAGRAGRNRVRFQGRLTRRRSLRPGAYRLVVAATDSAGQRSARKTASFRLLAR
jgi:hypothetical protein